MAWTCAQIDERLTEYVDRLLSPSGRREFAAHAESCPRCARLVAQVSSMVARMHRLEPLEAPPRLIHNILDQTLGPRAPAEGWQAWLGWLRPVLQPRFALGAVTVFATASIMSQALGLQPTKLSRSDLNPVNLYHGADRRVHLLYGRGVKFVNDLRVVYEIQSRLRPQSEPEAAPEREAAPQETSPQPKPRALRPGGSSTVPIPQSGIGTVLAGQGVRATEPTKGIATRLCWPPLFVGCSGCASSRV